MCDYLDSEDFQQTDSYNFFRPSFYVNYRRPSPPPESRTWMEHIIRAYSENEDFFHYSNVGINDNDDDTEGSGLNANIKSMEGNFGPPMIKNEDPPSGDIPAPTTGMILID
jgi:hypothetical protein